MRMQPLVCVAKLTRHAPYVDRKEQEQPDHVDKVPIPSGGLKTDVMLGGEITLHRADQTDAQKDCSNDNVEAVKACCHKEG